MRQKLAALLLCLLLVFQLSPVPSGAAEMPLVWVYRLF